MKYGMVIDLRKCVGCNACTVACKQENGTAPGVFWSRIRHYEIGSYPQARLHFLPIQCMHCQEAPCLAACPTGATYRREDGLVLIHERMCIGCRYCILACPYEARTYVGSGSAEYFSGRGLTPVEDGQAARHPHRVVEKCTLCAERLDRGAEPACVATCPAEARIIGDLDDQSSRVARLVADGARPRLEELQTKPSLFFIER